MRRARMAVFLWLWAGTLRVGARELDPAACAARFDVQRDKIIRTEESREMGARYLSELDVGARRECLRLCCETDGCDVFVFEERSPGSCYLFKCGPPEDFRCKFTSHGNFSSGVLALSRRLAELQDQERLVPERRPPPEARGPSTTASPPRVPAAPHPPPLPPDARPPATSNAVRLTEEAGAGRARCSRYQFECRAGGECIAVYNACDGVPQCADGSDEAPELGCPSPAVPAAVPHAPATAAAPPQVPNESDAEDGGAPLGEPSGAGPAAELWPHRLAQAQQRYGGAGPVKVVSSGADSAPHIFSHKGGLVQELGESAFEPPGPPAPLSWPRHVWQAAQHRNGLNIAMGPDRGGVESPPGPGGYWSDPRDWSAQRLAPVTQQMSEQRLYGIESRRGGAAAGDTMPELPLAYAGQPTTLRDAPKKGFELAAAQRAPPAASPPPPPPPPTSAPALQRQQGGNTAPLSEGGVKKKVLKEKAPAPKGAPESPSGDEELQAQHERWASDEHEGLSERPPAALLLLVLGTLMTAALGALAGCRLRAATRRRRHKRYALDADYLVNGMYL